MVRKPVRSIIGAIDAAAARWNARSFAPRASVVNAVAARTGYSLPAVEYAVDCLFGTLRRDRLEAVIADELGSLDVLDRFVERTGRPLARALPLGRVCIVSSRTTIGVAILPAVFALCAKCDVLVKDREDHLVAAFFETLAETLPELRDCATAQIWHGDGDAYALTSFEAVVAFGNDATLAQIATALSPRTRFIGYGSKASAGFVTRATLEHEDDAHAAAEAAALDLSLYESEGCLSLHALFVERGAVVSPERFAAMLADEMQKAAIAFPAAPRDPATASRIAARRDLATFRGAAERAAFDPDSGYLTVLDPPFNEPPLFLPRAIGIRAVDRVSEVAEYFDHHGISIEALAVTESRSDLLELATRLRAARVAKLGTLQAPPAGAFHGGRPRIAEFVRWVGNET
ncbi:MAG: acyl-CoA reductase [Candidatus Cybelea sp.]